MIKVEFLQLGTLVYLINANNITKYKIVDIFIEAKQAPVKIQYKIINLETQYNSIVDSDQVFSSLDELKEHIDKQFVELTPKESEEPNTEKTE